MRKRRKKIHIIGIGGKLSAPLAAELKRMGYQISGSDKDTIYPPASEFLAAAGITYQFPYREENVPRDADLVIVAGSALIRGENPEVTKAKQLGIPIISQAQAVSRFVVKKHSLVVAGSHGKTTTAALLAFSLRRFRPQLSWMFGGFPRTKSFPPLRINAGSYSVVEGDEYPTLHFDSTPKFFYYRPELLVLTGLHWEHQDVYPTREAYWRVYQELLVKSSNLELIVANGEDHQVKRLVGKIKGKKIFFYSYQEVNPEELPDTLFGDCNRANVAAVLAVGKVLGIKRSALVTVLKDFPGLKKRLELKGKWQGALVFEDIAQTKPRVVAGLAALRQRYPKAKLWAVFDPHASFLQFPQSLVDYPGMFDLADFVVVTRVTFRQGMPKKQRVTGYKIVKQIAESQPNVCYLADDSEVRRFLKRRLKSGDVLVVFSSGKKLAELGLLTAS